MSKKKNRKIIPYRKPHNINVGMIIFGIIFLYMLFNIFAYFRKDHVQFYEVMEGGIVNNKQYTADADKDICNVKHGEMNKTKIKHVNYKASCNAVNGIADRARRNQHKGPAAQCCLHQLF